MKLVSSRFLLGSVILLFVDVLWVASSEITEYLYHEKNYNKPFFTAYIKSVMFSVYLLGFIFCESWWLTSSSQHRNRINEYYLSISDSDQQNLSLEDEEEDDEDSEEEEDSSSDLSEKTLTPFESLSINSNTNDLKPITETSMTKTVSSITSSSSPYLGNSVWVPMKRCSDTSSLSGKSSETEEENFDEDEDSVSGDGDVFIETIPRSVSKVATKNSSVNYKKLSTNKNKQKIRKAIKRKKRLTGIDSRSKSPKLSNQRSVRFSKLIEVRQLSDKHADDAFLSRLSHPAFMRILYQRSQQTMRANNSSSPANGFHRSMNGSNSVTFFHPSKLNVKETMMLAFYFTSVWFAANLSFHMGLQYSEAGLVNVLSSTTPLFTLLLGIIFPSGSIIDSLSLTKLLCVLVSISSVAVISNTEPHHPIHPPMLNNQKFANSNRLTFQKSSSALPETIMPLGSIWSLCGAFFYAVYIVLMRYNVTHDLMLNFPMFFGFIGFFSMILMWPIILLLSFTQVEVFEWPDQDQWLLILVNGLCGTVVSELLWLLGSFMTSSLVGTIAVSFTIPMAVFFDIFVKQIEYPRIFFIGTIPMFLSFFMIVLVSQYDYWDPILEFFEKCVHFFSGAKKSGDSTNGVITNNVSHHHRSSSNDGTNKNTNSKQTNSSTNRIEQNADQKEMMIQPEESGNNTTRYQRLLSSSSTTSSSLSNSSSSSSSNNENDFNKSSSLLATSNRRFEMVGNFFQARKDSLTEAVATTHALVGGRQHRFGVTTTLGNENDEDQEQRQSLISEDDDDFDPAYA